ncbi:MAG TPA: hypothetical protein VHH94_00385 [Gammaproteobacteria bacterium]|nr:hypothetical protein [Gammaproteobacteria bacterium]
MTIANPWSYYAKLLRKESLACEGRLRGLRIIDERIAMSIEMNLEFADQLA